MSAKAELERVVRTILKDAGKVQEKVYSMREAADALQRVANSSTDSECEAVIQALKKECPELWSGDN